ncbi:hypothetical protein H1R81_08750 [Emticicia sp. BO119]|nr:hypothetical protein [Emticicia sp. BO119]
MLSSILKTTTIPEVTLYSEEEYKKVNRIYLNPHPDNYSDLLKAWAVFVLSKQSYLNTFVSGWKYNKNRNRGIALGTKKAIPTTTFSKRLDYAQIFCLDAIRI